MVKLNPVQPTDGKLTGVVNKSITGVVNSAGNIAEMRDLLAQGIEPQECNGECNLVVSGGPLVALVEAPVDNDDVGDYVQIVPGRINKGALSGKSDASVYVQLNTEDIL